MSKEKKPYSYHTFLFPFLWNDGGNVKSISKFEKCLNEYWKFEDDSEKEKNYDENYNTYHYFNSAARNAIYNNGKKNDKNVVHNYRYDIAASQGVDNDSKWLNEKKGKNNPARYKIEKTYTKSIYLDINVDSQDIKIYKDAKREEEIDHVKKISDVRLSKYIDLKIVKCELKEWEYEENGEKCKYDKPTWLFVNNTDELRVAESKEKQKGCTQLVITYVKTVFLPINGIRLKLFNTGIGIIMFELENHEFADEKEIVWINDFGRRIYMPYCASGSCGACADEISIYYGEKAVSIGKLIDKQNSYKETRIAKPVLDLLSNGEYKVTTTRKNNKKEFLIEPIIDDRMYVACYYINKDFVDSMSEIVDGEYKYLYDAKYKMPALKDNNASRVYEMLFVDGTGMSCHSRNMMKQLLENHVYDRWLEYSWEDNDQYYKSGTITGITEYSMICVSSTDEDFLVNPFLTMYMEILVLVLAQRASLLAFERMISNCALGKGDAKKLQECYVKFQSQLSLEEVTPQQQGIELYKMLLKTMFIEKQTMDIENQTNALFAQKNYKNESTESIVLLILAMLGICDAINYMITWGLGEGTSNCIRLISSVIFACVIISIYFISKKRNIR